MKKALLALPLMLSVATIAPDALAWGLPKVPGMPASPAGGASADVEGFMTKAAEANRLFQESAILVGQALLTDKAKIAEMRTRIDALKSVTDPKEKDAKLKELAIQSQATIQAAVADESKCTEQLKAAKAQMGDRLGNALFNYVLGVVQAKELVPAGQSAIASVQADPMQATKLVGLKNTVSDLTGIAGNSVLALTTLPKLAGKAQIPLTVPTTAATRPVPVVI